MNMRGLPECLACSRHRSSTASFVRLIVLVSVSVFHQLSSLHRAFLSNGQYPLLYIQVAPLEGNQLSLPKPCRQCQQEHGKVAQSLRRVQIVLHFCGRQHIGADLLELWVVKRTGRIIRYQAIPHRLVLALLQQPVDVTHGMFAQTWVIRGFSDGDHRSALFLQEISDLLYSQFRERYIPQSSENVVFKNITMGYVCGRAALVLVIDLLPAEDIFSKRHIPTSMH